MADSDTRLERRFTIHPVDLRAKSDEQNSRRIGGYAAMFNSDSRNLGGFVERVAPTFFNYSKGLNWREVMARYNHDDNMLLGTTSGGTLRLRTDEVGLDYEIDLPESRSDIAELVGRGDITKSSFAFIVHEEEWSSTDQGFPLRTLVAGDLIDVAPVNVPAYIDTSVAMRRFAQKVEVDVEEVRSAAIENDLQRFFKKSSKESPAPKKPKTLGPVARMEILGREQDPWA